MWVICPTHTNPSALGYSHGTAPRTGWKNLARKGNLQGIPLDVVLSLHRVVISTGRWWRIALSGLFSVRPDAGGVLDQTTVKLSSFRK